MNYHGTIIEESLENIDVLNDVKIISTKVEQVVEEHKTPWLKQWTLHKVEILEDQAGKVADEISKSLDSDHGGSWYTDYKNDNWHYIIFRNKVFKINRENVEEYQAAQDYGISLGIPAYQVDFTNIRPETTLFMLVSVDGKISTGDNDTMDVDKDYPEIQGVKDGLHQYYDIEQTTDLYSLNSGRVMAKMGVNNKEDEPNKTPVNYIVIDDNHLTEKGILYLTKKANRLYLATANENHPAITMQVENLEVISYKDKVNFKSLFMKFKSDFGIDKITIQTGGTLNSILLRQGLIDHISIVLAPCLVGGKDTSSLIDGESLHSKQDLINIKPLKLISCEQLDNSYLHLKYDVLNK